MTRTSIRVTVGADSMDADDGFAIHGGQTRVAWLKALRRGR